MAKDYGGTGSGRLTPQDTNADLAPKVSIPEGPFIPEFPGRVSAKTKAAVRQAAGADPVSAATDAPVRERRRAAEAPFQEPVKEAPTVAGGRFKLPEAVRSVSFGRKLWFGLSFAAPVLASAFYLFLIAPDQYITEYRFSVRVPVGQAGSIASSGASLSALFGGNPTPGTDLLDNYTVADYVGSPQAAHDLDAKVNLGQMYNKPSDPFSRIGDQPTAEKLARYWQSMVYSSYDVASGLAVVRVKAYTAQDSYAIATNLVSLSSDLVNAIGTNSQQDSVRYAQQQLDHANEQVARLRGDLANLRVNNNIVDPNKDVVDGTTALIDTLTSRRAQLEAQRNALLQRLGDAHAPQITLLDQQIAGLAGQITGTRDSVGATGRGTNMAATVGRFEDLQAKLKNAATVQASANAALSNIQASAEAQRLYLTTYVKPQLPQTPLGPNRWLDMLLVTMLAAMAWVVGRLIGNSIMEHA